MDFSQAKKALRHFQTFMLRDDVCRQKWKKAAASNSAVLM
jgi:hypothetical protein